MARHDAPSGAFGGAPIPALARLAGLDEEEALRVLRLLLDKPEVRASLAAGAERGQWPRAAELLPLQAAGSVWRRRRPDTPRALAASDPAALWESEAVGWLLLELLLGRTLPERQRQRELWPQLASHLEASTRKGRGCAVQPPVMELLDELLASPAAPAGALLSRLRFAQVLCGTAHAQSAMAKIAAETRRGGLAWMLELLEGPKALLQLWLSPREGVHAQNYLRKNLPTWGAATLVQGVLMAILLLLLSPTHWQFDTAIRHAWYKLAPAVQPVSSTALVLITQWEGTGEFNTLADMERLVKVLQAVERCQPAVVGVDVVIDPRWKDHPALAQALEALGAGDAPFVLMKRESHKQPPRLTEDSSQAAADWPALADRATDFAGTNLNAMRSTEDTYLLRTPADRSLAHSMARRFTGLTETEFDNLPQVMTLRYWEPASRFQTQPSWVDDYVVLDDRLLPSVAPGIAEKLSGRAVIVGVNTPQQDRHNSPFNYFDAQDGKVPGVLLHLFALESVLTRAAPDEPAGSALTGGRALFSVCAVYWALALLTGWFFAPFFRAYWLLAAFGFPFLLGVGALAWFGVLLPCWLPFLILALTFPTMTILGTIRRTFEVEGLCEGIG